MSLSSFNALLESWDKHAEQQQGKVRQEISLFAEDRIKLKALAEVYQLPLDDVVASLIHLALFEIEEKMPYVAGSRVIRIEEGANIYEDVGPMAKYLEAQKRIKGSEPG